jgi:hypothetical protein
MNPFGLLPPFGLNDQYQLLEARARARLLREEWRLANARPNNRRNGPATRLRARVGRSMVRIGERLAAPDAGAPRMSTARPSQTGC